MIKIDDDTWLERFVPTVRTSTDIEVHTLVDTDDTVEEIVYGLIQNYGVRNHMRWSKSKQQWCSSISYNAYMPITPESIMEIIANFRECFDPQIDQYFPEEHDFYVTSEDMVNIFLLNGDVIDAIALRDANLKELEEESGGDL
jgi:hypothetical protein